MAPQGDEQGCAVPHHIAQPGPVRRHDGMHGSSNAHRGRGRRLHGAGEKPLHLGVPGEDGVVLRRPEVEGRREEDGAGAALQGAGDASRRLFDRACDDAFDEFAGLQPASDSSGASRAKLGHAPTPLPRGRLDQADTLVARRQQMSCVAPSSFRPTYSESRITFL